MCLALFSSEDTLESVSWLTVTYMARCFQRGCEELATMIRPLIAAAALVLLALPIVADPCPCIPISHLWTVRSCDTFDCASSEFTLSAGSGDYVIVPTSSTDVKWVVLQRVAAGTATSSDPTFTLDAFDGFTDASLRYMTIASELKPMIMSAPDGRFLVIARQTPEPRRRAAGH